MSNDHDLISVLSGQPPTDRNGYPSCFSDLQINVLRNRCISGETAAKYRLAVYDGKALASRKKENAHGYGTLPVIDGTTGIVIPYPTISNYSTDIADWDGRATYHRVRLDVTEVGSVVEGGTIVTEGKDVPRYLAPSKAKVQPYLTWSAMASRDDVTVPLVFCEAPLKALSIEQNLGMAAIGLGGVSAGFKTDGQLHSTIRTAFVWTGRTVYIAYDAGLTNNPLVAKGAASLALLLLEAGADVRLARLPLHTTELYEVEDQGPDDYMFRHGTEALRKLFEDAESADPVTRIKGNKMLAYKLLDDLYTCAVLTASPYKASQYPTVGGISKSSLNQKLREFAAKVESPKAALSRAGSLSLDDIGLGNRLARHLAGKGEYVPQWHRWMLYRDGQWTKDDGDIGIQHEAKESTAQIVIEAESANDDAASQYEAFYARSRSERGVAAAVKLCRDLVRSTPESFISDPKLLNVANGILNLETGELGPHKPEHRMTYRLRMEYDPSADTSVVDTFLEKSQPDPEVRAYLWRLLGYSMTGLIREHVFPVHYGTGRNGKGTLFHAVNIMMGDLGCNLAEDLLLASGKGQHPTSIATLFGKRLALASEVNHTDTLNVARIKRFTGGDVLTARGMGQDFYDFKPTHHIHMLVNDRPRVPNAGDKAIWARVHLVPWTVVVPEDEQIQGLQDKLSEDPGLFRRLVEGAMEYFRVGLRPPQAVRLATSDYQTGEDRYADWLDECVEPSDGHVILVQDLFENWSNWSKKRGLMPEAFNTFSKALELRGIGSKCMGGPRKKTAARAGVRLVTPGFEVFEMPDDQIHAALGHAVSDDYDDDDAERYADQLVLAPTLN